MKNGSIAYDANASVFSFDNQRVDYKSYVTTHTIKSNQDGEKELANPEWILLDQFSRANNRCERIVYPSSIPEETRTSSTLDPRFHTNNCYADDGSVVKIVDGVNNTFNRFDSTNEVFNWNEGFSRAENVKDMARLLYQYMFQYNQPWSPNLNGTQRLIINEEEEKIQVPETTIDVKKHLTLSWLPKTDETMSDRIIVNGTGIHTGMYTNADGMVKDIESDRGFDGSQPNGSAKEPIKLLGHATKEWNLENAVSDQYVLQFTHVQDTSENVIPGYYDGMNWVPFSSKECIITEQYHSGILNELNSRMDENCKQDNVVGFHDNSWWIVLNSDVEMALIDNNDN